MTKYYQVAAVMEEDLYGVFEGPDDLEEMKQLVRDGEIDADVMRKDGKGAWRWGDVHEISARQAESTKAFNKAIDGGRLSNYPPAPNYAGNYMYMGHEQGKDMFKNKDTRRYDV